MKKIILSFLTLAISVSLFAGTTLNLNVKGMHCGGCEVKFKSKAQEIKGVTEVNAVSASNNSATLVYDSKQTSPEKIVSALAEQTGYTISVNTSAGEVSATGKPAGCCMSGQSNPSCKSADKAKCAKTKCDKTTNP